MEVEAQQAVENSRLHFYGGAVTSLIPFIIFVIGVITIALSGAPDERGFWPVLLLSLTVSLLLAKDKTQFSEVVIKGMSQPIVMIMIMAWILASTIGVLMSVTGFVEALSWLANQLSLGAVGFVLSTFIICCIVSLSTGSSFATILICGPLLYPAGGLLGAHLATLAGAIIGGATFGDFFAPISDTTIASTLSQKAPIGLTVKSRLKYILPASCIALIAYGISAFIQNADSSSASQELVGQPAGLLMLLVPIFIIYLFLKGKHLLHGLLLGLAFGTVLSLVCGLLPLTQFISLDLENFRATSFVIDGINKAIGISIFTILLMGLVATLKASGLVDQLVNFAESRSQTPRQSELWIAAAASVAVLLITHSIVAILTVSEFADKTGRNMNISAIRRSNLLSLVVCVFPFLLPYFIPVILMASTSSSGQELGIATVSVLEVGIYNFLAWGLMLMTILAVVFGYGHTTDNHLKSESTN